MLEGCSIVCFAHDWDGNPTSKTHIMRILARKNRVLWVNSIGMRRPQATRRDFRRIIAKLRRTGAGCVEAEPNLFVANPLVVPLPGVPMADAVNAAILTRWIRRLCRTYGLERPILWTFLPNVARLVGRLGERLVIYHCVDEYSAFAGVDRASLARMERDLLHRADLVITSSQQLADERRQWNSSTHFISHGVAIDLFAQALDPRTEVPEDLRRLRSPIIGFFGAIAEWVDVDLVRRVALARPEWSFVLIGRALRDVTPLHHIPNVHLLGPKAYAALPGYCRGFDVAMIPFTVDELTVRANPLKLREYLAAGLPVVATALPEIARYNGLVHLATNAEEFTDAIAAALKERSPAFIDKRLEAMRHESWDARVDEISDVIDQRLRRKA
jgi:glycosyltransferase involved in cell wall biosynthesis